MDIIEIVSIILAALSVVLIAFHWTRARKTKITEYLEMQEECHLMGPIKKEEKTVATTDIKAEDLKGLSPNQKKIINILAKQYNKVIDYFSTHHSDLMITINSLIEALVKINVPENGGSKKLIPISIVSIVMAAIGLILVLGTQNQDIESKSFGYGLMGIVAGYWFPKK